MAEAYDDGIIQNLCNSDDEFRRNLALEVQTSRADIALLRALVEKQSMDRKFLESAIAGAHRQGQLVEREECAKFVEAFGLRWVDYECDWSDPADCVEAIRERLAAEIRARTRAEGK